MKPSARVFNQWRSLYAWKFGARVGVSLKEPSTGRNVPPCPVPFNTGFGEGALFGIALAPHREGVYLVNDGNNTLALLH
jgi:hypothetical protein